MKKLSAKKLSKDLIIFAAFGFGLGKLPKAPGTYGSILAIPIFLLIAPFHMELHLWTVLLMSLVGIWICDVAEKETGKIDNPGIVWDEITGCFLAFWQVPVTWAWILYTLGLFRILDIWKPWPISYIERKFQGGVAIMLDDILAGIIACGLAHLTFKLISHYF